MRRFIAIIFLLQGLCPVLIFGCIKPSNRVFLVVAIAYALIALGLWMSKRWVFVLAILVTFLQTVTFSFPSFAWGFYIGPTVGPFFTLPLSQADYGAFFRLGVYFTVAVDEPGTSLQRLYQMSSNTFVLLNVFSIILTALLVIQFFRVGHQPPNNVLEPTATAP